MRIGFLGNQNNYPFILARALRRAGHEVTVVIDRPEPLDRPEHRYRDVPYPYPAWIRETAPVGVDDVVFRTDRWRAALAAVAGCDALVTNRWAHAVASEAAVPVVALTTGFDVEFGAYPPAAALYAEHVRSWPRPRQWVRRALAVRRLDLASWRELVEHAPEPLHTAWHAHVFARFVRRQRAGLRRAVAISALPDAVSAPLARVLRDCLSPGTHRLHLLMADTDRLQVLPAPRNPILRFFNAARLLWHRPFPPTVGEWADKGTDVLLRGVAAWRSRAVGRRLELHLVEKGPSVRATRALVAALGLDDLIVWRQELSQAALFEEYGRADVITEQCGQHILGMAAYEAMACGRPVLANATPGLFSEILGEVPPAAHATNPSEVAEQIDRLSSSAVRADLAQRGRRYVLHHLSPDRAARQVARILADACRRQAGRPAA